MYTKKSKTMMFFDCVIALKDDFEVEYFSKID